jgi:rod shape-determining protein MreC
VSKSRLIFFLGLFLTVAFFWARTPAPRQSSFPQRVLAQVFRPVATLRNSVTEMISVFLDRTLFVTKTSQDNEKLRAAVETLALENQSLHQQLKEWIQTRQVEERYTALNVQKLIKAQILSFDPMTPAKSLLVDAGEKQGISVDNIVLVASGLVGRVIKVYDQTSQVLLVTDPHFSVDALNENTKMRCLVRGLKQNKILAKRHPYLSQIEYLEKGLEMNSGDLLVTSGLGGLYPAGIPVGKVIKIESNETSVFQSAVVLPAVDMTELVSVYLYRSKTP